MSGYATITGSDVQRGSTGSGSGAQDTQQSILSAVRTEQGILENVLIELQAQSAMQAAAYDLYDGPDAYRPTPPPTIP